MPSDPPHPYELMHEFSKTVITLATALLGVSIAFINETADGMFRWLSIALLFGSWIVLLLCIRYATNVPGHIAAAIDAARVPEGGADDANKSEIEEHRKVKHNDAVSKAAWTYRFLIAALVFMTLFGAIRLLVGKPKLTAVIAIERTTDYLQSVYGKQTYSIKSLEYKPADMRFEIQATDPSQKVYDVWVDASNGVVKGRVP